MPKKIIIFGPTSFILCQSWKISSWNFPSKLVAYWNLCGYWCLYLKGLERVERCYQWLWASHQAWDHWDPFRASLHICFYSSRSMHLWFFLNAILKGLKQSTSKGYSEWLICEGSETMSSTYSIEILTTSNVTWELCPSKINMCIFVISKPSAHVRHTMKWEIQLSNNHLCHPSIWLHAHDNTLLTSCNIVF